MASFLLLLSKLNKSKSPPQGENNLITDVGSQLSTTDGNLIVSDEEVGIQSN